MKRRIKTFWNSTNGVSRLFKERPDGTITEYRQLPRFPLSYKDIFDEEHIRYSIIGDFCVVHDPDCVEYEPYKATLKMYENVYCDNYINLLPTQKMYEASVEYANHISNFLYVKILEKKLADFDHYFINTSKDGISLYCTYTGLTADELSKNSDYFVIILSEYVDSFSGLVIHKPSAVNKAFTVKVPKQYVGQLIGTRGKNVAYVSKKLHVKYIHVTALY